MEYITTKEAAAKWGISPTRITILANEGRIPGAQRLGRSWLIPANATKPERKPNHSPSIHKAETETNDFSFPLYHFRPDWSSAKEAKLSKQQKCLLSAETAVLECRFSDAYPLLESILHTPDDITTEIGCLWNAGICCIALNKHDDFSRIYLRLQMLLSEDFPHRNDLVMILDYLKTYIETIDSSARHVSYNTSVHDQCLPLIFVLIGYAHMIKEAWKPGSADTTLLELCLRFLQNTSAIIAMEMMHFYLLGIYSLRQDMVAAEKHATAAVQLAFENRLYFPLVTFYRYNVSILSPILAQYPEDFQNHCQDLFSQYEKNFPAFLSSINESTVLSKLTDEDYAYALAALMGLPNTHIADRLGVHQQTVKRKFVKLYEKLGVTNKKELQEYLLNYM